MRHSKISVLQLNWRVGGLLLCELGEVFLDSAHVPLSRGTIEWSTVGLETVVTMFEMTAVVTSIRESQRDTGWGRWKGSRVLDNSLRIIADLQSGRSGRKRSCSGPIGGACSRKVECAC